MENSLLVMFQESRFLHLWAALFLVELLQGVPVNDMQQLQYLAVNTGCFKLSLGTTNLRQQFPILETSLMSVPPGYGTWLPV